MLLDFIERIGQECQHTDLAQPVVFAVLQEEEDTPPREEQEGKAYGTCRLVVYVVFTAGRRQGGQLLLLKGRVEGLYEVYHRTVGLLFTHKGYRIFLFQSMTLHIGEVALQRASWRDVEGVVLVTGDNHQSTIAIPYAILVAYILRQAERVVIGDVVDKDDKRLNA